MFEFKSFEVELFYMKLKENARSSGFSMKYRAFILNWLQFYIQSVYKPHFGTSISIHQTHLLFVAQPLFLYKYNLVIASCQ